MKSTSTTKVLVGPPLPFNGSTTSDPRLASFYPRDFHRCGGSPSYTRRGARYTEGERDHVAGDHHADPPRTISKNSSNPRRGIEPRGCWGICTPDVTFHFRSSLHP